MTERRPATPAPITTKSYFSLSLGKWALGPTWATAETTCSQSAGPMAYSGATQAGFLLPRGMVISGDLPLL